MAERAAIDDAVDGVPPEPSPEAAAGAAFCPGCTADVTALPAVARFCNRCGSALPTRRLDAAVPLPDAPRPFPSAALPAPGSEPFQPPLILLAYAKAMFNLGHRYETAIGSRRNLDEAARCYWKAARLGDLGARERCESGALLGASLPYRRVSDPGGNQVHRETPPVASVHPPAAS